MVKETIMNYKLTEKGKRLFTGGHNETYPDSHFKNMDGDYLINEGYIEQVRERIELRRTNLSPIAICKDGEYGALLKEFKDSEIKIMEHAINGEWDQIPECLQWTNNLYGQYCISDTCWDEFIRERLKELKR